MLGIGNVVAFNLLSDMPELGYLTNKEAASLIGVGPSKRVVVMKVNETYVAGIIKYSQRWCHVGSKNECKLRIDTISPH